MGGVVLFKERDGTIDAFASTMKTGSSMEVRSQHDASAGWGPVTSMGKVPETDIGLSQPSTVSQLPDGRVHLTVHEWNRNSRYWQITQDAPGGPWGSWQLCGLAKSGLRYDQHCLAVFTIRDGRIAEVREFFADTLHAKNVVFV
ncbi:hypothetical protein AB0O42_35995 [Streptomyces sp. NPDC089922]|uniref:hypothetical protein n=1 Tax=Streptomyces sp. NPDC089922 TaxID=3155189 RepID=UPI003419017D